MCISQALIMAGFWRRRNLLHTTVNWNEILQAQKKTLRLILPICHRRLRCRKCRTALQFDGSIWNSIDVGLTDNLFAVHGLDANNLVVVGAGAKSAVYNGTSWASFSSGNRDMLGVWMIAPDQIWASAKAGRIYGFDGTDWTEQTVGNRDLRDVYFLDSEKGYMVGRNGTLLAYNGAVWTAVASGSGNDLNGIFLLDETKGYIVGNDGIVISYQGDGFNSPYLKDFTVSADQLEYQLSNLAFGKTIISECVQHMHSPLRIGQVLMPLLLLQNRF